MLKVKRTTADFYPRSPCGERLYANFDGFYWWVISIHALLAESDLFLCCNAAKPRHFYPRSPCGERPRVVTAFWGSVDNFYPRSPCGERLSGLCKGANMAHFYPRSPCGERLTLIWDVIAVMTISIHALLAESDLICQAPILPCNAFLSTLSLRRATRHKTSKLIINIYFYPRSPCGERRIKPIFSEINTRDFYPRSPCGERLVA